MTKAIIENMLVFQDGAVAAGCLLKEGTVKIGDSLYYVDSMGKTRFTVKVLGIFQPPKTILKEASAEENKTRILLQLEGCSAAMLHVGHVLQSEEEEECYPQAPGCDAIFRRFGARYPEYRFPLLFGAYTCLTPGERGVLDNIYVYNAPDYYHFVTCGLSELYEKQNGNPERSGYGFELTCKLKKQGLGNAQLEIRHMCSLLQMLANLTVEEGHQYLPGQFIGTGIKRGFDAAGKTNLAGFVTMLDELTGVRTEFGDVAFIQLVGITVEQLSALKERKVTVQQILEENPDGLTAYGFEEPAEKK